MTNTFQQILDAIEGIQVGEDGSSVNSVASYTHGTAAMSTTSAVVLAANASRKHAIIANPQSGTTVFLRLAGATATTNDIPLYPGDRYQIDSLNLYTGEIRGITSSGSVTLLVVEGV